MPTTLASERPAVAEDPSLLVGRPIDWAVAVLLPVALAVRLVPLPAFRPTS